jgi:MFS family permease
LQLAHDPIEPSNPPPHPLIYTLLILPFGATGGFVSVALVFLATKSGLTVEQGASLIAVSMFPNMWKFFWAPLSDTTLTRKKWYGIANILCAIGMMAMAMVPLGPATLSLHWLVILLTSVAATFLAFSVEGIVAHITPPGDRGRVSGWFQAGNLGGSGIGGGLGLYMLETAKLSPMVTGAALAALCLACTGALLFVPDVPAEKADSPLAAVKSVSLDMWALIKSREGMLAALLCFVPIGTGAATGVLTQAEVAAMWGAGDKEVGLVQGFLTGIISMIGCLAGGPVCDRLGARNAYALFGAVMAVTTAGMAFSPYTASMYVGWSLVYAFVTGLCYAAFTGVVLDTIGGGNAATKYNGFASLSNTPIWYMGLVLASVQATWGAQGMLLAESAAGVAGILVFFAIAAVMPKPATAAT